MKEIGIITGASSGLGKEFVKQIAQRNDLDEIWIIARRQNLLDEIAQNINSQKNFNVVRPIAMDISGKDAVNNFTNLLKEENNKLEKVESSICIKLFINNAGFGTYGPFVETSISKQMDMIELNCVSMTGLCYAVIPYLTKGSVVINTASLAAYMPLGNFSVYSATKAYALSFSIALRAELKHKGIKVCALCPGSVSTDFANIASNGARKEVKGGVSPVKVVKQCIRRAYKGKAIAMYRLKWRITAFLSRFVGRNLVASATYKFAPRPHNPDEDMIKKEENISLSDFI